MDIRRCAILACTLAALSACGKLKSSNSDRTIRNGSKVKVNYTLTVDGKMIDASNGQAPFEFVEGSGQIVPGLEEAVLGMKMGDKRDIAVPPEKGYGLPNPKAVRKVPKKAFKKTGELKPGMMVGGTANGHEFEAKVLEIGKDQVTLDFNHPLAGKTLAFNIEVVDVSQP